MTDGTDGQVNSGAAEIYETFFVPALFRQWAGPVADAADVKTGDVALDVACGTGVVTREIAGRVGPDGQVVGLDCNRGMLAVAQRSSSDIEWREGRAEALPFDDGSFDAVTCQFGLMFFDDRVGALAEMQRVLKPGGRLVVAVWDALASTPGYDQMVRLLERMFGNHVADALRAPFSLGNPELLSGLFVEAGVCDARIATRPGMARFPTLGDWVHINIKGWTLADMIDDDQFQALSRAVDAQFTSFVGPNGEVSFAAPAHIVTALRN